MTEPRGPEYQVVIERDVVITMSDGIAVRADVYRPAAAGRFPALYAVSPYGKEWVHLPATPVFRFRETGHIEWFVERGYAYVLMDCRGTGASKDGVWEMMGEREQQDMYDAIEWTAAQPWCSGRVGMIGESYFGAVQWLAAAKNPPHLTCIAPYDAFIDLYRDVAYHGGILCSGFLAWWTMDTRARSLIDTRATPSSTLMSYDIVYHALRHPLDGPFWRERSAWHRLGQIKCAVYSIANWKMVGLHLRGNLLAYELLQCPKKLLVNGGAKGGVGTDDAQRIFDSPEFHAELLRWYDHWLHQKDTGIMDEPPVRILIQESGEFREEQEWPLSRAVPTTFYLHKGPSKAVDSINDGALSLEPAPADEEPTSVDYPDPQWTGWPGLGVGVFGKVGLPNPVKRVLTFTTPTLEHDVEVTGPISLHLWLSSDQPDTDIFVKLSDQEGTSIKSMIRTTADAGAPALTVTRGWMKASHRKLTPELCKPGRPWHAHDERRDLVPGNVVELVLELWPTSWLFKEGHRIRLEIAHGDSPVFDSPFSHHYGTKMGTDTIHHSSIFPSRLILPVVRAPHQEGELVVRML